MPVNWRYCKNWNFSYNLIIVVIPTLFLLLLFIMLFVPRNTCDAHVAMTSRSWTPIPTNLRFKTGTYH